MESVPEIPPLTDLVAALESATLIAKQLPSTTDSSQVLHAFSSLQIAHHQLGSFISRFQSLQIRQSKENSISSNIGEEEPMQIGDEETDETVEENSRIIVDKVEERMRNCVIQNKRRKRPLSPSSAAVEPQRPSYGNGVVQGLDLSGLDPQGTRLRSLDLVFQFHG